MTARILVGTCSWADKTLVDSGWYPATAKTPEDRLRFYAEQFPIVEVDATYYGLPSERNAALWVERTPDDFLFDVKAYALFTHHPAALRSLPKDLRASLPSALLAKRNLYYRDAPPARDVGSRRASAPACCPSSPPPPRSPSCGCTAVTTRLGRRRGSAPP